MLEKTKRYVGDVSGLLGIASISVGTFIFSIPIGFIVTGLSLVGLAYLMNGGD